jgi:acyl carrier protein
MDTDEYGDLLKSIWEKFLGTAVRSDTDFFDSKGDSLTAMRMFAEIEAELGVALRLRSIFDNPRFEDFVSAFVRETTARTAS